MSEPRSSGVECPECGARISSTEKQCWLCQVRFKPPEQAPKPTASTSTPKKPEPKKPMDEPVVQPQAAGKFGGRQMPEAGSNFGGMVAVAVIMILLVGGGLMTRGNQGIAVAFAVTVIPAIFLLIAVALASTRGDSQRGVPKLLHATASAFLATVMALVLIAGVALAALVAFFIVCTIVISAH